MIPQVINPVIVYHPEWMIMDVTYIFGDKKKKCCKKYKKKGKDYCKSCPKLKKKKK